MSDQTGSPITSETFRGQLTFYTFSYSGCDEASICPQTTADIQRLTTHLETLETGSLDIGVATILLNPNPVDPADLSLTIESDQVKWQALQGDSLRNKYVVGQGFQVYYSEEVIGLSESDRIPFAPRIVLVDGLGIIRAEYRSSQPDLAVITRDVELLVKEAESSGRLSKIGYEAAHLFVCYP